MHGAVPLRSRRGEMRQRRGKLHMTTTETSRLDELIAQEKRNVTREHFAHFWDAAMADGIDLDIIADEVIAAVIGELVQEKGAEEAGRLITRLGDKEAAGAFLPKRTLQ